MPTFMDHHSDLQLPPDALEAITRGALAGEVDEFGVRQVELFHNPEGAVYCLLEAPDADAVRAHHAALGVACGQVDQVASIR